MFDAVKLKNKLLGQYSELKDLGGWQAVADLYNVNKTMVWRIANTDYIPKDQTIRQKLGLPVSARVFPAMGEILNGSAAPASRICPRCGNFFIPNAGKREKCYVCVPYRNRKQEALNVHNQDIKNEAQP